MKDIVLAIIGSGALSALVSGLMARNTLAKKTDQGVRAGVRQLLYDRIKWEGKKYIADGHLTSDELEDLSRMWSIYHTDLGGNGFLDSLMAKVKNLPIQD